MTQSFPATGERILALVRILVLARHCNAPKTSPTQKDEERALTELGIAQAKKLGRKLEGVIFNAVLGSPLLRVAQTLEIATEQEYGVVRVPGLGCPTTGHPVDTMWNALGYKPLSKYFAHEHGLHMKAWGNRVLEEVLDALGTRTPNQVVLVGGHAVLLNALAWAVCDKIKALDMSANFAEQMVLSTVLGEGEAFKLTPHLGWKTSQCRLICEHIKLD